MPGPTPKSKSIWKIGWARGCESQRDISSSTVISSTESPDLVGKRVPQVPRHQARLQLQGAFGAARLAVVGRYGSVQYEDDLNSLRLPGYTTLDALGSVSVSRAFELFLAGENLTGVRVVTGKTPRTTLGPPRQLRGGLRLKLR